MLRLKRSPRQLRMLLFTFSILLQTSRIKKKTSMTYMPLEAPTTSYF
jgi:hypothetical protein